MDRQAGQVADNAGSVLRTFTGALFTTNSGASRAKGNPGQASAAQEPERQQVKRRAVKRTQAVTPRSTEGGGKAASEESEEPEISGAERPGAF